ncbi:MAG: dTDP-4-dehydrorhamnose reductase [Candidatus Lumbricidophila eiseniae]|uniref:dTDP-4-dehydrorhamnose reductase n=1 Tax=Candidatus Lumbricidiphila eiseniae TaxID=1969409 RepID=A0A2A6FSA2_9MICO|nr:MAG: dTDP-4-dehydrorhamnose reductase [Candidatus Lumbricidophila eiseniae]
MVRYLVTGASGMLGRDIVRALGDRCVTALSHSLIDITDSHQVADAVHGHDVVINCAAYTAVDLAESHENEAYAVNAIGTANLARAAAATRALFVQPSTDYVFDGKGTSPYRETDTTRPLSAYGRTKEAGEKLARAEHPDGTYIVRTAWVYGEHGRNFARTMLALAAQGQPWTVVNDQVGQPTLAADLAAQLVALVDARPAPGIYHATNTGETTWYDFGRAVLAAHGADPELISPASTDASARPAPRPHYSVLSHGAWLAAGLPAARSWQAAIEDAAARGILAQ